MRKHSPCMHGELNSLPQNYINLVYWDGYPLATHELEVSLGYMIPHLENKQTSKQNITLRYNRECSYSEQ